MIFSFSVPEGNPRYTMLVDWYNSYDTKEKKMERSRDFRELFMLILLGGKVEEKQESNNRPKTTQPQIELKPVNLVPQQIDIDFDSKLDNLTF